jgi:hypothetical protein
MSAIRKSSGVVIAATAAALFLGGLGTVSVSKTASADEVKCTGINACKGQSACKTASSSCKGQNACKGQGWLPTASADECTSKGGQVAS